MRLVNGFSFLGWMVGIILLDMFLEKKLIDFI